MTGINKVANRNKIKDSRGTIVFRYVSAFIVALASAVCVIPFLMILSGSFSENSRIVVDGYSIFPQGFTLDAYKAALDSLGNRIFTSYGVTICVTAAGTALGTVLTAMGGYVLSRPDFKHRNKFALFIYFTSLFSGGMIPSYLVIANVLHLNHMLWAVILPGLLSPFNIFLFRNYVKGIPDSLMESARIDGAGDFKIFYVIVLPLSKPVVATIALFLGLGYWNNWYSYSLYLVADQEKWGLQFLLYRLLQRVSDVAPAEAVTAIPSETIKMATAMLATGPILLLYPFVQRYFVGGITIGGVKG